MPRRAWLSVLITYGFAMVAAVLLVLRAGPPAAVPAAAPVAGVATGVGAAVVLPADAPPPWAYLPLRRRARGRSLGGSPALARWTADAARVGVAVLGGYVPSAERVLAAVFPGMTGSPS